jgi:hypothetical protein
MPRFALALAFIVVVSVVGPAGAGPNVPSAPPVAIDPSRPWLVPPVDGPIVARFQAPGTDWGPGHRGIDYFAAPASPVRAAGAGRVVFSGLVAGVNAVSVEHAGGMTTTYTDLADVLVEKGAYVLQGEWIGHVGVAHRASGEVGLHFGVKIDGTYVNPEDYLGPLDVTGAIYLAPLIGGFARELPGYGAGSYLDEKCMEAVPVSEEPPPPNDNVVVVVPGLGSRSTEGFGDEVFRLADRLGYSEDRTFFFSYRGSNSTHLHEPYGRVHTYDGLHEAAGKLAALLVRVADRHPGIDIDLLGYSQGGLVARDALERMMMSWGPGLPRIDHLVMYATPHAGSKLAEFVVEIGDSSVSGAMMTEAVSRWARSNGSLPDPNSAAVADMRPDSAFLGELADHDVVYGTRVLSLSTPNDWLVPAARAAYEGARNEIVAASGISGHTGILWSRAARDLAHGFLRDAPPACLTDLDHLAPLASRLTDFVHDHAADLYAAGEEALMGRLGRLGRAPRRR